MIAVPEGLRADGAAGPPAVVMFWIKQGYETNEAKGIGTGTKIIDASRTPYICEEVSSEAGNADQLAGLGRGQNTTHRHATGCGPNNEDATKSTTATDSSNKITDGSASASVVYHSRGVHVTESKESTKLSIDLPGVKANDVQVVLENGKLRVKAERKAGKQVTFHRELPIDDSVIESSMASLVDGVLTISLTKKQSPESVSVAVASEYPPESITEENVHFSLDLPGVKSSDLKVTRLSGNIAIEGERKNGQFSSTVKRSYEVDTKTVDVDSIRAFLADGVLTFVAPRKEGPPALTIPVSTLIENSTSEPPKKQAKLDIESSETAPKQSVIPEIEDDKTKPSSGSNEKEWEHVVETVPDEGVKA